MAAASRSAAGGSPGRLLRTSGSPGSPSALYPGTGRRAASVRLRTAPSSPNPRGASAHLLRVPGARQPPHRGNRAQECPPHFPLPTCVCFYPRGRESARPPPAGNLLEFRSVISEPVASPVAAGVAGERSRPAPLSCSLSLGCGRAPPRWGGCLARGERAIMGRAGVSSSAGA